MMNRTQSAAEQSKGTSSVRCRQILKQFGVVAALFAMVATVTVTTGVSSAGAAGTCVRAANDDGTVTLAWDADGDDKWVVREGTPGANEFATTVRNLPAFTGGSAERDYTIRYVEQGDIEVLCTAPVEPPPADGVCSVTLLDNGDVALTVVDNEAKTWAWRRGKDGAPTSYKGEVENFAVVDPAPAPGTYTYEVVSRFGAGVKETDSCGTITIEAEVGAQDCSVSLSEDGTVTVAATPSSSPSARTSPTPTPTRPRVRSSTSSEPSSPTPGSRPRAARSRSAARSPSSSNAHSPTTATSPSRSTGTTTALARGRSVEARTTAPPTSRARSNRRDGPRPSKPTTPTRGRSCPASPTARR